MSNIKKLYFVALLSFVLASMINVVNVPQVKAVTETHTRTFTTKSSDGSLSWFGGTYTEMWNETEAETVGDDWLVVAVGQSGSAPYVIYRGFLFFDTSIIPYDANITSANLTIYGSDDYSTTDFDITIQNGQPTYPHDPLVAGDYYQAHYSGNGGSVSTSSFSTSSYNNITLNADGRSWINIGGTTKLCLRSNREISAISPTTWEFVEFHSAEAGAGYQPQLHITYETSHVYLYRLYGAYDEQGYRDGAINVTFYRPTQESINFTLDGYNDVTSQADTRMVFHFDIGYNESRVFYVGEQEYMDIYVFRPSQPYYTYYFTVIDFVGITNGYLETLLNINGTDRIVERWRLDVLNDIPFTLSWGVAYKVRIVCDQGTYLYGIFVAGATNSFTLTVTRNMFPLEATHIGNITISVNRTVANTIQINYTDVADQTAWVYVAIYELRGSVIVYTTNNTGNNQQITWSNADNKTDYRAHVVISHAVRGSLSWSYVFPAPETYSNPWAFLNQFGSFPFDLSQLIGIGIVTFVFGSFSSQNAPAGMVVGVIVAILLTAIGFLNISWAWLTVTFAVAIIAALSMQRKRSERVV